MSEIERLREALRQAYREGFDDAVNDESAQYCGGNRKGFDQCWRESKSISAHAALSSTPPVAERGEWQGVNVEILVGFARWLAVGPERSVLAAAARDALKAAGVGPDMTVAEFAALVAPPTPENGEGEK